MDRQIRGGRREGTVERCSAGVCEMCVNRSGSSERGESEAKERGGGGRKRRRGRNFMISRGKGRRGGG